MSIFLRSFFLAIAGLMLAGRLEAKVLKHSGIIYNMQGPRAAAWDFYGNSEKWLHENDREKDIINTTEITDRLPFFRRELKGGNGTSFVKVKNVDLKGATYTSVKKLFEAQTAVSVIKRIATGDVYILKLKNSDDYVLLKISGIKDDGTSLLYSGNNMDYIAFEYTVFKLAATEAVTFLKEDFEKLGYDKDGMEAEILIYPNPVTDKIHVKFRQSIDTTAWVIQLENMEGNNVYRSEQIYETYWVNDFKALSEGRYILSVLRDDKVQLQKIIDKVNRNGSPLSEIYQ